MTSPRSLLVLQTAFPGDVILTLPLVQLLHDRLPGAQITVVTTPAAAPLLEGHPAVTRALPYDKRGIDAGIRGLVRMAARLRALRCDAALIPHRSLRSALVAAMARIPVRIGFDRSAGRVLLTHRVRYVPSDHEIARNLALARGLGIDAGGVLLPRLYPSAADARSVDAFLRRYSPVPDGERIAVAPGSVWATKRWPAEKYGALIGQLAERGLHAVLVGGAEDRELCTRIAHMAPGAAAADAAGRFSLAGSAALIARCRALVANDSAPVHIASAMGVPVVAVFGPTLPSFGFAPAGPGGVVVETAGLACRPCSIHGGNRCPTGTFDCMGRIAVERVLEALPARSA